MPPDAIRPFDPGRFGERWTDPDDLLRACLATYVHEYSGAEVTPNQRRLAFWHHLPR